MRSPALDPLNASTDFRFDRPPVADKLVILRTAARYVARQHPEQSQPQQCIRKIKQWQEPQKNTKQIQYERKHNQGNAQLIRPVSADHKVANEVSYH